MKHIIKEIEKEIKKAIGINIKIDFNGYYCIKSIMELTLKEHNKLIKILNKYNDEIYKKKVVKKCKKI